MNTGISECVEDQLDRLNSALTQMFKNINEGSNHIRYPSSSIMSIAPAELWNEPNFSDSASNFELQEEYERRIEDLLLQHDRFLMNLEDFRASEVQKQVKLEYSFSEINELIDILEKAKNGQPSEFSLGCYHFFLIGTEDKISVSLINRHKNLEYTNRLEKEIEELKKNGPASLSVSLEGEEVCNACGLDAYRLKKEVRIDMEREFKMRKNEAIEKEKANIDVQLEELDKLKESFLGRFKELVEERRRLERKAREIEKKELGLAQRRSAFEKKKHEWENKLLHDPNNFEKSFESAFSPSNFSQKELEQQLKDLKDALEANYDSKLAMKINQIETQLSRYRTEKAIFECSKNNSMVSSLVKTFDNETSQDEIKRKRLLDRTNKRFISDTKRKTEDQAEKKRLEDATRQGLEKKYEFLIIKEKELQEKEKYLQDTWKKIPGADNLVEVIQTTVERLDRMKLENEINYNRNEQDKINLKKASEKILETLQGVDLAKGPVRETLEKIKEYLVI